MNATGNVCRSEDLGGYVLVVVGGEVDLSWSQQVRDAILAALGRCDGVGVELAQVTYIDSSGIAALVEGFQTARGRGRRFGLVAASRQVLAVLQLARLDKVFPLFADVESARAG
ncbi:MAG: STAS domain-containing protein [Proteobacteria bacterium]|nr:STAS domain-containing protein [Pseudomonadota bacterium]